MNDAVHVVARDAPARARPERRRLPGVDAVRALAIIGMFYVHVLPASWLPGAADGPRPAALSLFDDALRTRSMSLFVFMAGVSFALMTGGTRPLAGGAMSTARRRLAVRAALLVLIGLTLEEVVPEAGVIVAYYGLWTLLLLPVLRVRAGVLFTAAGVLMAAGPALFLVATNWGQGVFVPDMTEMPIMGFDLLNPAQWPAGLRGRLGSGYPITYTLPLLLAGLAVGRLDLHDRAVRVRMLVAGVLVAAVAWVVSAAAMAAGVSAVLDRFDEGVRATLEAGRNPVFPWESLLAMPPRTMFCLSVPALVLMAGAGTALVGGVVTLMERPVWRRALWPLAATGSLALTWYAAHLLALRAIDDPPYSLLLFLAFTGYAMVFSVVWRHLFRRGPLEWLVHRVTVLAVPGLGEIPAGPTRFFSRRGRNAGSNAEKP